MRWLRAACLILLLAVVPALRAQDANGRAIAALRNGDLKTAESILRVHLKADPSDAVSLQVLAIVLDQEKKYAEADKFYRRALAAVPHSPGLLNNYGNHLLAMGKFGPARKAFLEVLALDPTHANANEQLARIALLQGQPSEALAYLKRLPPALRQRFDAALLEMSANYALHRNSEGDALLARVSPQANSDARESFALAEALSSVKHYETAEKWFSRTLNLQPDRFEALYDLGLAASHAGHSQRAREVLQQALEKQPKNVDVLYNLAAVDVALGDRQSALALLVRARREAPERKDVAALLARTAADLGYFGDAIRAWEAYLKLAPNDQTARRERAFAESAIGKDPQAALMDLIHFAQAHPRDAVGYYELGTAESATNAVAALKELNRALAIEPDLAPAHFTRGLLRYRQGDLKGAEADFAFAAKKQPENAAPLDHLAEIYIATDRTEEALPLLRKAAALAPDNSRVQLHLGHALVQLGKRPEAMQAFTRYRELNTGLENVPHATGLVEFLGLSPAQQYAQYRAGVERAVKKDPQNAEAQVRYLGIVLNGGNLQSAREVCGRLAGLRLASADLRQALDQLLNARQYALAESLLGKADATARNSPGVEMDDAIAALHTAGPAAALAQLNRIPESGRSGDYDLAQAQILEAMGHREAADAALAKAMHAAPKRAEFYGSAALLLVKIGRIPDAIKVLDQGIKAVPEDLELRSVRALLLETDSASAASRAALLDDMQSLFN